MSHIAKFVDRVFRTKRSESAVPGPNVTQGWCPECAFAQAPKVVTTRL